MKLIEATTLVPPQEAFPSIKLEQLPRGFRPVADTDRLFYHDDSGDLIVKDPSGAFWPCPDAYSALEMCQYIHEQARDIRESVTDKWWYKHLVQPLTGLMVQVGIQPPTSFQLNFYGEPITQIEEHYAAAAKKIDSRIERDQKLLIDVQNGIETVISDPLHKDQLTQYADILTQIKLEPMMSIAKAAVQMLVGGDASHYFPGTVSYQLKIGDFRRAQMSLRQVAAYITDAWDPVGKKFVARTTETPEELRPAA